MQHEGVVTGTIVGLEHIHIRHHVCLIRGITRVGGGNERSEQVCATGIGEGAIAVISLLVRIIGAGQPAIVEGVLRSARDVNGVGSLVTGTDEIACAAGAAFEAAGAGERVSAGASGKSARAGGGIGVINALKCGRPSILSKIVIEQAESGAQHRLLAAMRRPGESKARRDLLAVIVRHAGHDGNLQGLQGDVGAILKLGSA